jgi:hypothetical protein
MVKITADMKDEELIELMKNPKTADESFAVFKARGEEEPVSNGSREIGFKTRDLIEIIKNCPFVRIQAFELLAYSKLDKPLTLGIFERGMLSSYIPYTSDRCFPRQENNTIKEAWNKILEKIFNPEEKEIYNVIKALKKIKKYPDFWCEAQRIFLTGSERIFTGGMEDFTDEFFSDVYLKGVLESLFEISEDLGIRFFEIIFLHRQDNRDEIDLKKTLLVFQKIPILKERCRTELESMKSTVQDFTEIMERYPEMQDECLIEIRLFIIRTHEELKIEDVLNILKITPETPNFLKLHTALKESQRTIQEAERGLLDVFLKNI